MIASRELADAAAALQRLAKKKKPGVAWANAMQLAASLGDTDTALAAAKNWLAEAPHDPQRIVVMIDALGSVAKHGEAARLARQLQDKPAAAADGFYLEGVFQARLGNREKALALFRQALAKHPAHPAVWEQIALLNGYEDFDADLQAMLTLAERIQSPEQLTTLYYALGRAYDHTGDIDRAFQYYSAGAGLREKTSPYNPQPLLAYLERRRQVFTPALFRQLQNDSGGENMVFILSAPRSGTTLIEQILATSPSVTPTGEHTLLRLATLRLGSMEPQDMARINAFKDSDWRKMAQSYQTGIRRRFGAGKIYTDKTIINYYYAGAIKILFPAAKFIWCVRDIRDTAWSCFRSRISANEWAQKLDNTIDFLQAHRRLCEYWSEIFGENFITMPYEKLIAEPEATTDALFAHAGAAKPDGWDEFYKNDDAVATASLAQVRRPLNNKAVGSWRRYEKYLAPIYDKTFR